MDAEGCVMKLYITDLSMLVLLLLYLPLVLFLLWRIVRSKRLSKLGKAVVIPIFLVIAYAIPLGDVTINSIAMAKVCPNAGLHVYKQVKVDGYFDPLGSLDTLERFSYRFIEVTEPGGGVIRLEKGGTGMIEKMRLARPTAQHEIRYEGWHVDRALGVSMLQDSIKDRTTGEVLGERLLFNPIPGWVDRTFVLRWFGEAIQGCHGQPDYEFRSKVLLPNDRRG
jgi:hypothetical protein